MILLIFHVRKHIGVACIPDIFFKKKTIICKVHDFNVFFSLSLKKYIFLFFTLGLFIPFFLFIFFLL